MQEAVDDLTDTWDYTAQTGSENQADNYYGMIKIACREILKDSIIEKN